MFFLCANWEDNGGHVWAFVLLELIHSDGRPVLFGYGPWTDGYIAALPHPRSRPTLVQPKRFIRSLFAGQTSFHLESFCTFRKRPRGNRYVVSALLDSHAGVDRTRSEASPDHHRASGRMGSGHRTKCKCNFWLSVEIRRVHKCRRSSCSNWGT